uniref:Peroxidase 1 n=1 Tax=Musa acuminata subsp. malaccensis TaxID=214687 RepID=A0A804JB65_MUSAM
QLSTRFYDRTCPKLRGIVRSVMAQAVFRDRRMGASILRLFFHDCFVNGCDASVLLDDTRTFTGEKNSNGNQNSLRGFEVIDAIKARVEAACNATVSCADILALAARDGVVLLGGPTWLVPLGRRDARTASIFAANANLPLASSSLSDLISLFARKGLDARDLTALSGAHTVGQARCTCPAFGGDGNLAPLDLQTPLFNGGSQDSLVRLYSSSTSAFFNDFVVAMVKMGNISPLTGWPGEIRLNCRKVN